MRFEINQHLQIVNQIYTLYLAGATALFAASMSKDGKYNLLLLVPFLSLGAANLLGSHERNIGCIAAYCANNLEEVLRKNSSKVVQWDNSSMLFELKDSNFISNKAASLALVAAPGAVALAINICKFYTTMKGFPSPTLLVCLVYLGWLFGIISIYFTYQIISNTAEYREKMGKSHRFPEKAPYKTRRNTTLQASQVSGRSDILPRDSIQQVENISNSDATKLHTEVNEYINQKLTILNISITVFGVVMGWVVTGLFSIQNSLQGASDSQVSPVSVQPVTLLLPTVLLFFLCIMLWYIEAINKQMHILSTYLEVFHLSDWESHYQDLLKSTRLNAQSRHKNRRPSWWPQTYFKWLQTYFKWPQTYSIQSDMPYIILGALIILTIVITFAICVLYWQSLTEKTSLILSFFGITSLISLLILIILWLRRDLDPFRLKVRTSWEDIRDRPKLNNDEQ
jgi:hypothetical protein